MESQTSLPSWKAAMVNHFQNEGKISTLEMLASVKNIAATMRENRRNSEAEAAHVRKSVWGEDKTEDDEMEITVLGDYNPTPPQPPPQKSNLLPMALALALGASPGLAALGYVLANRGDDKEFTDQTVTIGLGKIEDYLQDVAP